MKYYASFPTTASNLMLNRAINYGDGMFETMLVNKQSIPLWDLHYQRLTSGLERFKIDPVPEQFIRNKILSLAYDKKSYIAKLMVFRSDEKRGYGSQSRKADYYITVSPYNITTTQAHALTVSPIILAKQHKLAGIKHLNRLEQVLAAQNIIDTPYQDALMLDEDNNIIETISKNIVLIKGDQLYTPHLNECGVYGVGLRWLQQQDYTIHWKKIEFDSLSEYDGLMVSNSIRGFNQITHIDKLIHFKQNLNLINEINHKWNRYIKSL